MTNQAGRAAGQRDLESPYGAFVARETEKEDLKMKRPMV